MKNMVYISQDGIFKELQKAFEAVGIFPTLVHEHGEIMRVERLEGGDGHGCIDVVTFDHSTEKVSLYGVSFKPASSDQLDVVRKYLEGEKKKYQKLIDNVGMLLEKTRIAYIKALQKKSI